MKCLQLFLLLLPLAHSFRQQSVGVKGKLTCGNKPLANTTVKLWDKKKIGRDDQLAETRTDSKGVFQLEGGIGSVLPLDVRFKVYHNCDDAIKPCERKVALKVPSTYVTRTSKVQQYFDAGALNMMFKYPDEERSCTNG